jgi:KipI family sensor histidine kinase inhibitor
MRIFPLGDNALTIEFGNEISLDLNARAIAVAQALTNTLLVDLIEAVPAYASVTIYFDPLSTKYITVKEEIKTIADTVEQIASESTKFFEIPMVVSPDTSPDLHRIAGFSGLSENDALDIFLSQTYRVYMLGFLPGFAYMAEVDDRIAAPRLETPRSKVSKGSVGIAGKQTGIYPLESPGGWNIIGRTDQKMFDHTSQTPCLLKPGDEVRFVRC